MEKNGAITERTPGVERERQMDKGHVKSAQVRDAARLLKDEHKKDEACRTSKKI